MKERFLSLVGPRASGVAPPLVLISILFLFSAIPLLLGGMLGCSPFRGSSLEAAKKREEKKKLAEEKRRQKRIQEHDTVHPGEKKAGGLIYWKEKGDRYVIRIPSDYQDPVDIRQFLEAVHPRGFPGNLEGSVGEKGGDPPAPPTSTSSSTASSPRPHTFQERWRRYHNLLTNPDAADLEEIRKTLQSPADPLSPLAARILGKKGGEDAERALLSALQDRRKMVRREALAALVEMRSSHAASRCRSCLAKDPSPDVRLVAVAGLGVLRDREGIPLLRRQLEDPNPEIASTAAWALALFEDPVGFEYLEALARSPSPDAARSAMKLLAGFHQRRSLPTLLQLLRSGEGDLPAYAMEALSAYDEREIEEEIASFPPSQASAIRIRYAMLSFLRNGGEVPEICKTLATGGEAEERRLAVLCLARRAEADDVPFFIEAMEDPVPEIARLALAGMQRYLEKKGGRPPAPIKDPLAWRIWWLRQHVVVATQEGRALIRTPDGAFREVRVGTCLLWDAHVTEIRPGMGPEGIEGAAVTVVDRGRPYLLLPPDR